MVPRVTRRAQRRCNTSVPALRHIRFITTTAMEGGGASVELTGSDAVPALEQPTEATAAEALEAAAEAAEAEGRQSRLDAHLAELDAKAVRKAERRQKRLDAEAAAAADLEAKAERKAATSTTQQKRSHLVEEAAAAAAALLAAAAQGKEARQMRRLHQLVVERPTAPTLAAESNSALGVFLPIDIAVAPPWEDPLISSFLLPHGEDESSGEGSTGEDGEPLSDESLSDDREGDSEGEGEDDEVQVAEAADGENHAAAGGFSTVFTRLGSSGGPKKRYRRRSVVGVQPSDDDNDVVVQPPTLSAASAAALAPPSRRGAFMRDVFGPRALAFSVRCSWTPISTGSLLRNLMGDGPSTISRVLVSVFGLSRKQAAPAFSPHSAACRLLAWYGDRLLSFALSLALAPQAPNARDLAWRVNVYERNVSLCAAGRVLSLHREVMGFPSEHAMGTVMEALVMLTFDHGGMRAALAAVTRLVQIIDTLPIMTGLPGVSQQVGAFVAAAAVEPERYSEMLGPKGNFGAVMGAGGRGGSTSEGPTGGGGMGAAVTSFSSTSVAAGTATVTSCSFTAQTGRAAAAAAATAAASSSTSVIAFGKQLPTVGDLITAKKKDREDFLSKLGVKAASRASKVWWQEQQPVGSSVVTAVPKRKMYTSRTSATTNQAGKPKKVGALAPPKGKGAAALHNRRTALAAVNAAAHTSAPASAWAGAAAAAAAAWAAAGSGPSSMHAAPAPASADLAAWHEY